MISIVKKQLLMLALVAGIVAPVSAMDTQSDSGFGWKSVTGITAVVCAGLGYYAYKSFWKKPSEQPQSKAPETPVTTTPPTIVAQESGQAVELKLETPEDYARAQAQVEQEIAALEKAIQKEEAGKAQASAPVSVQPKRPAGPAGRRKPTVKPVAQKPEEMVEESEVTAKAQPVAAQSAPKKPLNGQSYGVSMADLQKRPLKKTGKAPAKKVPVKK